MPATWCRHCRCQLCIAYRNIGIVYREVLLAVLGFRVCLGLATVSLGLVRVSLGLA